MRRFMCAFAVACLWLLAPVATQEKPASKEAAAGKAAAAPATAVNLNTATATQIATLPGIGPKAAERIIEYRQKNGGFKKIEELMNVKGIGEKSFLKLKPLITVGDKAEKPASRQ
jgi:competence protein ComEA